MINIIISVILVAVVGMASFYIWKEKRKVENVLDALVQEQHPVIVNKTERSTYMFKYMSTFLFYNLDNQNTNVIMII